MKNRGNTIEYTEQDLIEALERKSLPYLIPYIVSCLLSAVVAAYIIISWNDFIACLIFAFTVFFIGLTIFDAIFTLRVNRKCPDFIENSKDSPIVKTLMKSISQHFVLSVVCCLLAFVYVVMLEWPYL